jgi:SAM-dependent methyltransferase
MEQSYAAIYHNLEENHWWFLGRRDMIYRLIKDCDKNSGFLEIGCSGGPLMEIMRLRGFKNIKGIDIDEKAVDICRQKGISDVHVADGEETGFNNQQFDFVIASDVLEHFSDENKALSEWSRILKKEGKLIIFVPAFQFLWSDHDEVNHHYRRYSKSRLAETLRKNGFNIERVSYWNFSLFLPVTLLRHTQRLFHWNRKKIQGELHRVNPFINRILEYILRIENQFLLHRVTFPFGLSVFAIARKS